MSRVPLRVRDCMTRRPITVEPTAEITHAVRVLIERDVSGVLVVDSDGGLCGVLTERDCLAVATAAGYHDERGGPVADYMSSPVETVDADENLVDVAIRMTGSPHRRYAVLEHGRLAGLIGRRDVLRAVAGGSSFTRRN